MNERKLTICIDGSEHKVARGSTVAAVLIVSDCHSFRHSVTGEIRGPLCGMGICFECRATVNGVKHARTCVLVVEDGMEIITD